MSTTAPPAATSQPLIPTRRLFQEEEYLDLIDLPIRGGPTLFLRRLRGTTRHERKAVLLVHGASAAGDTFLIPSDGTLTAPNISLVDFLGQNFDVWILDWTGSLHVTARQPDEANRSVDDVARTDFSRALETIWERRQGEGAPRDDKTSVVAHCMGAACLSMAIGAEWVSSEAQHVDNILLSTIGLFYEVAWDGWTKVQDRVLERCRVQNPPPVISPTANPPWPGPLADVYRLWPRTWGWKPPFDEDFFRRLAFMFGEPFLTPDLAPAVNPDTVRNQFGAIPFTFYRQCAQNVLRSFAGELDAEGQLPAGTTNETMSGVLGQPYLRGDRFRAFPKITLLTGAQNPLWHRDSIDKMGEWLARFRGDVSKFVLEGFGHQDLWWSRRSAEIVFPIVYNAVA
jgi:hypothetical protein